MLMSLPNKIILLVAGHLPTYSLSALLLMSKTTRDLLSPVLYKRSAVYEGGKWEHPLIWAVEKGSMTVLERLLLYNKALMATAALRVAVDLGNEEAVTILLNAGVDPFYMELITKLERLGFQGRDQVAPTDEDLNPILYTFRHAFDTGNIDIAELILTETILAPSGGICTELFSHAFKKGNVPGMTLLYHNRHEINSNPNNIVEEGLNQGSACILDHDHELVQCIWEHGSVLHNLVYPYICAGIEGPTEGIFKLLVGWRKDIDTNKSIGGHRLLHTAAREGHLGVAKCLLDHGADVDSLDKLGTSSLVLAARMKQRPMIKFLLAHGADVNLQNLKGNTAQHLAAWDLGYGSDPEKIREDDVVRVLLAHGA